MIKKIDKALGIWQKTNSLFGSVAQLARASDSYSLGPGFESLHCHQITIEPSKPLKLEGFLVSTPFLITDRSTINHRLAVGK